MAKERSTKEPTATYDYADASGTLLYQVMRFDFAENGVAKKTFRQRRPAVNGDKSEDGWVMGLHGLERRVIYRAAAVQAAIEADRRIFLVEGEKCVHALEAVGCTATTTMGGSNGWRAEYAEAFRAASVVILPDNDEPGDKYAAAALKAILPVATSVKVLRLPGLGAKGDVADWLASGRTVDELRELANEAPLTLKPEPKDADIALPPHIWPMTDLGNAERLVARHGDKLRYNEGLGWLVWCGRRWVVDASGDVHRLAQDTARSIPKEGRTEEKGVRRVLMAWAKKSESDRALTSMVQRARWQDGVYVLARELDTDPWLLNVENGMVDLRTGELLPHDPTKLLSKLAPVTYDPTAACPNWDRFLKSAMPDSDDQAFLSRYAGYSATGIVREAVFPVMWGTGRNGKSTFFTILGHVLGDYATTVPADLLFEKRQEQHPTGMTKFFGRRFVWASEPEKGKALDLAKVKLLTGKDPIDARYMNKDFFSYYPTHKLAVLLNNRPKLNEINAATRERIRLVPWTQSFVGDKADLELGEKLLKEASGILNWIIVGAIAYCKDGLGTSKNVTEATSEYFDEEDTLGAFLADCATVGERLEVASAALRTTYEQWCRDHGEEPLGRDKFGEELTGRGFRRSKKRSDGNRWWWSGFGLKAAPQQDERGQHRWV